MANLLALSVAALALCTRVGAEPISIDVASAADGELITAAGFLPLNWTARLSSESDAFTLLVFPYLNMQLAGAEGAAWGVSPCSGDTGLFCATGTMNLALPAGVSGFATVQLAIHGVASGPSAGNAPPAGALMSASNVSITITPLTAVNPRTRRPADAPTVTIDIETWFTPLNFYWQGGPGSAEAIPSVGRYASNNTGVMRSQLHYWIRAGVDALAGDWTNNLWSTPSWAARAPNVQELVNTTSLLMQLTGQLAAQGWAIPSLFLLLGLDNGPTAPLPAIFEEMDFMAAAYVHNTSAGPYTALDGQPLAVIFDGTGANHSDVSYPGWTIRWMASQDQVSGANERGYWSWMDGVVTPPLTPRPGGVSGYESATVTPAFFNPNGWTGAGALGRQGGLTLIQEFAGVFGGTGVKPAAAGTGAASALAADAAAGLPDAAQARGLRASSVRRAPSHQHPLPAGSHQRAGDAPALSGSDDTLPEAAAGAAATASALVPDVDFLHTCQWNEFAGQANGQGYGPNHDMYFDSYSADLSNDIEPVSTTACGYMRPGGACGGWGYRPLNVLAMMIDATHDVAALDDTVTVVHVLTPAVGVVTNYTATCADCIDIAWYIHGFNSSALPRVAAPAPSGAAGVATRGEADAAPAGTATGAGYVARKQLPVEIAIDGVVVASAPAGETALTLNLSVAAPWLDRRFPHRLTITAQPSQRSAAGVALGPVVDTIPGAAFQGPRAIDSATSLSSAGGDDHLTRYPLSLEAFDDNAPLARTAAVPAIGEVVVFLPEWLAARST